jgi:hypothetical protein
MPLCAVIGCCLFFSSGCTTSDDAKVASAQLALAAKALSAYYTNLQTHVVDAEQVTELDQVLIPDEAQKYTTQHANLVRIHTSLEKRVAMAKELSTLATSFAGLSGSKVPADVSASATKLQTAIASLGTAGTDASEAGGADVLEGIATAILEHKERKVASLMGAAIDHLAKRFETEEPFYKQAEQVYIDASADAANALLKNGQVDTKKFSEGLANAALTPYGLTESLNADTETKLKTLAPSVIDEKGKEMSDAHALAADEMEKALTDMASRLNDIGAGKKLSSHLAPLSLDDVNAWTAAAQTTAAKGDK